MQNAETALDVLQSPESPVHRKGARWVRRKAARKRPTPDHRERDLAAQPILLLEVLLQYHREVALSGDQELVEAFPAERADEAFRDRVRTGRPDRGADDPDVSACEDRVEGGGELAVPITDQEAELLGAVVEVQEQVAACWVTQAPVGWAVIPARCTRRVACSITTRM